MPHAVRREDWLLIGSPGCVPGCRAFGVKFPLKAIPPRVEWGPCKHSRCVRLGWGRRVPDVMHLGKEGLCRDFV